MQTDSLQQIQGGQQIELRAGWVNRTVVGIILATFLSDVSHEMRTEDSATAGRNCRC